MSQRHVRPPSALALALAVAAAACSESVLDAPDETTVEVQAASTSAAVGESVEFQVEARGESLLGLTLSYGDGAVDSLAALGAQTAGRRFTHAWSVAGTFQVVARAVEAVRPVVADTVVVEVVPVEVAPGR